MKIYNNIPILFSLSKKTDKKESKLSEFYDGFRNGIREVKSSIEGKAQTKDASTWLDKL